MIGKVVAGARPTARAAQCEETRMLARAVVLEPRRLRPALELVLSGGRVRQKAAYSVDLARAREVRGAGDGELVVSEIWPRSRKRQRLNRLRRRAEVGDERRVAGRLDHPPVLYDDRLNPMSRLDDSTAAENDLQWPIRNGSRGHDGRA